MHEPDVDSFGARTLTRDLDESRAAIHPGDTSAAPRELARVAALAASEIEHRLVGDLPEHGQHARQQIVISVVVCVGVQHPLVGYAVPRTS